MSPQAEVFPADEPDIAIPPGETIAEWLEENGMSQAELAVRTGLSPKHINQLVAGVVSLTHDVAGRLEAVTAIPARLWLRMEADFRAISERLRRASEPLSEEDADWVRHMPVAELVRRGTLPDSPSDLASRMRQLCSFFRVASRDAWTDVYSARQAAFRQSTAFSAQPAAVATWLRLGETAAQDVECQPYDAARLRATLPTLRALTPISDPAEFVPQIRTLCAAAGVATVIVPEITGARACGVTRWLTPDKAMVMLSGRFGSDDQLWFTVFHEICHVLKHGKRDVWIDNGSASDDPDEIEANTFAGEQLIPSRHAPRLRSLRSKVAVVAFAEEIGVSPGIVVGRLQHDGLWLQKNGNDLKRRYSADQLASL